MFYNTEFIKNAFGNSLPDYINWDFLFNIAYCIDTEKMKLYFMSDDKKFLYKCSEDGSITRQIDASRCNWDTSGLDNFFGYRLDYKNLVLDTVEDDIYYIYCEESGFEQTVRLLELLLEKHGISNFRFFKAISTLNNKDIRLFQQVIDYRAVSMVKVPLSGNNFKVYTRPYKNGNDFVRSDELNRFLLEVYGCPEKELSEKIRNMWVSYDFGNMRTTVSTQNDQLKEDLA